MGAWIETTMVDDVETPVIVAPYVGAWIETDREESIRLDNKCRTLRGCVD